MYVCVYIYIYMYVCIFQSPIYPFPTPYPLVCFLYPWLYFSFVNKFICIPFFLRFAILSGVFTLLL